MMGRAYTKYYKGFTLTFLHDSDHCVRCKMLSTFYTKMENKEPPWDKEDASKVDDDDCSPSDLKLYGVISYLNAHLAVNSCSSDAKNSNHVPVTARKKRLASNHPVNKKPSKLKSSDLTEKSSGSKAPKSLARKNMLSYQGYRKVVKKAAQTSTGDQTHEKALKTKILNLKSSPISPDTESNIVESNSSTIPPVTPEKLDKVSLKRKLRILNKLRRNNNYEDDIFEEKCFYVVKTTQDQDESDSSDIKNMATPKCEISLSPRACSESPVYEDCYSPKELGAIRRDAEEFRYQRKKRRRRKLVFSDNEELGVKEDLKSEDADHKTLLENVCKAVPLKPERDSDTDNSYFTDSSEDQS